MNHANPLDLAAVRSAHRDSQRSVDALQMALGRRPRFNLSRAIQLQVAEKHLDGYEAERDQEIRHQHAKHLTAGNGFYIEARDLGPLLMQRADVVGTLSAGGYLVETENVGLIELARPRSVALTLGATVIDGLVGNLTLPRVTAGVTTGWMAAETSGTTDSTQSFGQVSLTPKEISATTKVSRLLTLQASHAAQGLLAADIVAAVAQGIDVSAIGGTGTNGQPLGVANTAGIGTASGTTFNRSAAIDLQGAVGARLSPTGGYCASIVTAKLLAKRASDTTVVSQYVWEGGLFNGIVAGNRAIASDDVPAATVVYGSWDQLLVASWGALQIEVSPFGTSSTDFQQGLIALRVIHALDIGVRDLKAFSAATSVT